MMHGSISRQAAKGSQALANSIGFNARDSQPTKASSTHEALKALRSHRHNPPKPPRQEPSRPPTGWPRDVRSWPGCESARRREGPSRVYRVWALGLRVWLAWGSVFRNPQPFSPRPIPNSSRFVLGASPPHVGFPLQRGMPVGKGALQTTKRQMQCTQNATTSYVEQNGHRCAKSVRKLSQQDRAIMPPTRTVNPDQFTKRRKLSRQSQKKTKRVNDHRPRQRTENPV